MLMTCKSCLNVWMKWKVKISVRNVRHVITKTYFSCCRMIFVKIFFWNNHMSYLIDRIWWLSLIEINDFHWFRFYVNIFCLFKNYYLFIKTSLKKIRLISWFFLLTVSTFYQNCWLFCSCNQSRLVIKISNTRMRSVKQK